MSVNVNPTMEEINKFKVPLMPGERQLLIQLVNLFNSSKYRNRYMEIYVQPNLFFGKPDIIVVEKKSGVWIIEIKDYQSQAYIVSTVGNKDNWKLKSNPQVNIVSPFEQVIKYKKDLMQYANPVLESLCHNYWQKDINRKKFNSLVRTAIYFSNYTEKELSNLKRDLRVNREENMYNYSMFFGKEETDTILSNHLIDTFFEQMYSMSYQITDEQYHDIKAILDPGEAGVNAPLPNFTEQKYIMATESKPARRKIRGAAGSGKTTVLAKRVANCETRLPQGSKILVVTYNITMCNYIRDKIVSESGKTLNEMGVSISHYHGLYEWEKQNDIWREARKSRDEIFDAIFIDEGQDFEEKWFRNLIRDYLKNPEETTYEYVIFADEDQNVYNRDQIEVTVDGRKTSLPVTPVMGDWATLEGNFRLDNGHIEKVANQFKRIVLNRNLDKDNNSSKAQQLTIETIVSENPVIYTKSRRINEIVYNIKHHVNYLIRELDAKINDIVILSGSIHLMREIENTLRYNTREKNIYSKTATTFVPLDAIKKGVDKKADKSYKMKFFRNIGPLKISTVHSFKGWEAKFVILIIHDPSHNNLIHESFDDSYYVGLTRAKDELLVIDTCGKYEQFFQAIGDESVCYISHV